uniref:LisH domain-containing protein n=1 Tax=Aegilops tauschii subsp. strangulata TaxID=200361 RepID=A0A453HC54_AEGTS
MWEMLSTLLLDVMLSTLDSGSNTSTPETAQLPDTRQLKREHLENPILCILYNYVARKYTISSCFLKGMPYGKLCSFN